MKKALLFVFALAVIPVGVDAQVTPSASCADINFASSLEDLHSCAEQGNVDAQNLLGVMYSGSGSRVPEDDVEAVRLYRLAAGQGDATGQHNLGVMYSNGAGVPEDDVEAVRWFRLAAEQRHGLAQIRLGRKYEDGEGVPEDYVLAYMWFNLAAAQAAFGGAEGKDRIEQRMTREQIAEAQRLTREWLEAHPSSN